MKNFIIILLFFVFAIAASCNSENPIDFQEMLVGEWQLIKEKGKDPNLLIYPINNGGLFVYDNLTGKWRGYSAWLSDDRNTLLGRQ
jgi:hypothetical protein